MTILVVTPTLGRSPWLGETVESVRTHCPAARHVLVAPGATVAELAARFPGCQVVPETVPARGMYAAINDGVAAAQDWGAFTYLNDDDVLLSGFRAVVETMNRGDIQLAYGRVRLIDAKGRRLGAIPVSRWPELNRLLYAQRLEPVYQHGALVARAAWERWGGFDPAYKYCGDSEFFARLCVNGVPAARVGGDVAAFRLHAGQLTKNRAAMGAERAQVDRELGLLAPRRTLRHRWVRFLFRLTNLPVYAERIARHGFLTFDQVLERQG